jgi:hypothetical protein
MYTRQGQDDKIRTRDEETTTITNIENVLLSSPFSHMLPMDALLATNNKKTNDAIHSSPSAPVLFKNFFKRKTITPNILGNNTDTLQEQMREREIFLIKIEIQSNLHILVGDHTRLLILLILVYCVAVVVARR